MPAPENPFVISIPVILYNSAGMAMAVSNGVAIPAGTPGIIAHGSDGATARSVSVDATGKLNINSISGTIALPAGSATSALQTTENAYLAAIADGYPTFRAVADRIATGANKYILTLLNSNAARKVCIRRIVIINWQVAAGAIGFPDFELRRISARTAGAAVTAFQYDTGDALSASIAADTNSTGVTDGALFQRAFVTNNEINGSGGTENDMATPLYGTVFQKDISAKPLVLRNGEGFTIKEITSSGATVSAFIDFTDQPA